MKHAILTSVILSMALTGLTGCFFGHDDDEHHHRDHDDRGRTVIVEPEHEHHDRD